MYDPFAYGFAIALVELPYLLVQVGACRVWGGCKGAGAREGARGRVHAPPRLPGWSCCAAATAVMRGEMGGDGVCSKAQHSAPDFESPILSPLHARTHSAHPAQTNSPSTATPQALCFAPISYWMIGFEPSAQWFFYYLLMFLSTITFYSEPLAPPAPACWPPHLPARLPACLPACPPPHPTPHLPAWAPGRTEWRCAACCCPPLAAWYEALGLARHGAIIALPGSQRRPLPRPAAAIFGQFLVYITPTMQVAQVGRGDGCRALGPRPQRAPPWPSPAPPGRRRPPFGACCCCCCCCCCCLRNPNPAPVTQS
jgi:hypothetical protein